MEHTDNTAKLEEYMRLLREIDWSYARCDCKRTYDTHHPKWQRICQLEKIVDPDRAIMRMSRGE